MSNFYLVATPIGNLADFTNRAVEVLRSADVILAEDTRRTGILTKSFDICVPLMSLHRHNEATRIPEVLQMLDQGKNVALVSDAGTPALSDPGERLIDAIIAAGHTLNPIPGPSAVLTALVASGFPCVPFTFFGFIPKKGKDRLRVLAKVRYSAQTIVIFESPNRLVSLLEDLIAADQENRKLVVAREMTKIHEEFFRGTVSEALGYFTENRVRGEITVVVSPTEKTQKESEDKLMAAEILSKTFLQEGFSPSQVARKVSDLLEISKNKTYEMIHARLEKSGEL